MGRPKNWLPGEARIKLEILSAHGIRYEFYMPHMTAEQGQAFLRLALEAMQSPEHYAQAQAYLEAMARGDKDLGKKNLH